MSKVTLRSISNIERDGWMTKQGGSFKSWKRRWFILQGSALYYFKNNTPETELQGQIDLNPQSFVKPEEKHGKKQAFAVSTQKRIFFMYADCDDDSVKWIKAISRSIERLKSPVTAVAETANLLEIEQLPSEIRSRLKRARLEIDFLQTEQDNKVFEFWQIWFNSIPARENLHSLTPSAIEYEISASADLQKLTWRTAGPQNLFIQKMVDFFWNVGAPESEIDRLNDVGALINPPVIGSWIDMSNKDGMDGGWYFPSETPLKYALDAADPGEPSRKLGEWAELNQITTCSSVGRDMGAAPPRQTEIRFILPRSGLVEQLDLALSACQAFGFPPFADDILTWIRASETKESLRLSIVTSHEGFVRIGLFLSEPSPDLVEQLCQQSSSSSEKVSRLVSALDLTGPQGVEFQYLNPGFGYGVYKEGAGVNFHFILGKETA